MYPFAPPEAYLFRGRMATVAEHLGYRSSDKLLIINADDFGLSSSVNKGVAELFRLRKITSATVMVTAACYQDALSLYRQQIGLSCGIHLSLTSDHVDDGSRSVLHSDSIPSLISSTGRFHPERHEFFEHALPGEAYFEAKAQLERALADGIDVTHIDSHEGALQLLPEFAEIYVRLASEFRLPVRAGSRMLLKQMGLLDDWIGKIRKQGIHIPDNLIYIPIDSFQSYQDKDDYTSELIAQLPAGITEVYFHPTSPHNNVPDQPGESYRQVREWDYNFLISDRLQNILQDSQIILTNFLQLRELTRKS